MGRGAGGEVFPTGYWPTQVALFRNYQASSRVNTDAETFPLRLDRGEGQGEVSIPFLPCMAAQPSTNDYQPSTNRSLGSPYDALLIQFLLKSGLCRTEAECLDYPFGLAEVHYLTHLEKEGCLRIINAAEWEFAADCAQRDLEAAIAAGFSTAKEHFEHVLAEAKKKQRSEVRSQKSDPTSDLRPPISGLATVPPAELTSDLGPPTSAL